MIYDDWKADCGRDDVDLNLAYERAAEVVEELSDAELIAACEERDPVAYRTARELLVLALTDAYAREGE